MEQGLAQCGTHDGKGYYGVYANDALVCRKGVATTLTSLCRPVRVSTPTSICRAERECTLGNALCTFWQAFACVSGPAVTTRSTELKQMLDLPVAKVAENGEQVGTKVARGKESPTSPQTYTRNTDGRFQRKAKARIKCSKHRERPVS